jgi:DNA repair and recombination protein RAD52
MHVTQDQIQAQAERTERAHSAILAGKFQVTRVSPQQWTVKNGDKLPYVVTLKPSQSDFIGNAWTCTCMDFQRRGPQILCKHIEGVRLLEAAQNQIPLFKDKENNMNDSTPSNDGSLGDRLSRILWELRQPLDMSRVKRRQAPGMGSVPYLEGYDVIDRANSIFGFTWSFDLIGEPVITRWQKKVLIWNQQEKRKVPSLDVNGNVQVEEIGLVYITGKVTVDLDGKTYCHADLGRCVFTGDTPEALDMALAGSATDCLKRCFRQMGEQFGNSLYDKEIAQNAGLEQNQSNGTASSKGDQPLRSTESAFSSSTTIVRKYCDGIRVNGNASEQEAFDQFKEKTGKAPASKEELRTWLTSQRIITTPASVAA